VRTALISAITVCAERRFQKKARKFLLGLSTDELQYIAGFLGACVLESAGNSTWRKRLQSSSRSAAPPAPASPTRSIR